MARDNQLFPQKIAEGLTWVIVAFEMLLVIQGGWVDGGGVHVFSCWAVNEIEVNGVTIKCDEYNMAIHGPEVWSFLVEITKFVQPRNPNKKNQN